MFSLTVENVEEFGFLDSSLAALIPRAPTATDIRLPKTPYPPHLTPIPIVGQADTIARPYDHQILVLIHAYRGAIAAKKLKTYAYARIPKDVRAIKHYDLLSVSYAALQEHEIQPHPWCAFRLETYNYPRSQKNEPWKPAPVEYVYSVEAIEKHRGWYKSQRERFCGMRSIMPQNLRALLDTHARMSAELARLGPLADAEQVSAVVSTHFPGNAYEEALKAIRLEAKLIEQSLAVDVESGAWVWD